MSLPKVSLADPLVTPEAVIEQCAKALKARATQVVECESANRTAHLLLSSKDGEITALKAERDAWYRDWKTTGVIGFALAMVLMGLSGK